MNELTRKALAGVVRFFVILAVFLFLPAWSLHFWQAWVYWLASAILVLDLTLYFLQHDPRLIERRLAVGPRAEPRLSQKRIQIATSVIGAVLVIIPGLDHRHHWSAVPAALSIIADFVVAVSYVLLFYVFRANTFTAAVVTIEEGQHLVSSGPYAVVRHPMYAAATLQFLATPVALGSWWALVAAVPLCGMLALRILDEERMLQESLPGYADYCLRVRDRMIPYVW